MFPIIVGLFYIIIAFGYLLLLKMNNSFSNDGGIIFAVVFAAIGGMLITQTIRKKIITEEVEEKGEECFALIKNVYPSRNSTNRLIEYKADILIYLESQNKVIEITKIIGQDANKYPEKLYVKLKYLNNEINIIDSGITANNVPENIKNKFIDNQKSNTKN